MATGPRYRVPFRRRREGKTNYHVRYKLILSKKPRVVIRKSNGSTTLQLVLAEQTGDKTLLTVNSRALKDYGYTFSKGNIPAAYLTGLLFGKKMLALGISEGIADIGLHSSTKGNRIYAAIKGVVDAGVDVPHGSEILPEEDRISGQHIKDYTGADIVAQFQLAKEKILG
ncbi:MAG TPA: 50S ribosomal protein L18 [Methanothrix sp.]|jgi:large subunit ribosomal protein L18|nr:50S ribosomal protein L18 [Methanothrix sp.]HQJ80059.1 50S ribosomal protein L18 [Methanothrix sp.]HUM80915.1 50S ribosomal protein L18 [Methanothrix sp.]